MESLLETVTGLLPNLTEFRVPHVQFLITLVERVPFFISRIGQPQMSKLEKIWITFFIVLPLYFLPNHIYTTIFKSREEMELRQFVSVIQIISFFPISCCCIWYVWRNAEDPVTVADMDRFDRRFRIEYGDTKDAFASVWTILLFCLWCLRFASALFLHIPVPTMVLVSTWVVFDNPACQMFLLKQMVARRLQVVRKRIEQRDSDILATFPSVRALLKINNRVNEFYSPILFFWVMLNFVTALASASDLWLYTVLNYGDPASLVNMSYGRILIVLSNTHHLAMFFRTSVKDEVDAIDHEMDRSISDHYFDASVAPGPSSANPEPRLVVKPLEERKKIFTLMEELVNTPTEATALGLFTVNAASLTTALGLIIDLVAFLIQMLR